MLSSNMEMQQKQDAISASHLYNSFLATSVW